jgi:hypothetical protein
MKWTSRTIRILPVSLLVCICTLLPVVVLPIAITLLTSKGPLLENNLKFILPALSTLVSFSAFIISSISLFLTRSDRKRDERKSINDEFWFRTVLLPGFLGPWRNFIDAEEGIFLQDKATYSIDKFNNQLLLIRSRTKWFINFNDTSIQLDECFDKLESYIANECAKANNQPTSPTEELSFAECSLEVLKILNSQHEKISDNPFG